METRAKILQEAFSLIAMNGYDNTSISAICERVGVKKPTIYYYFKSKEELFITLIEEFSTGDKSIKFNLDVSKDNYAKELMKYGTVFINTYKGQPEFSKFLMELYIQSKRIQGLDSIMDAMNKAFKEELLSIVTLGQRLGVIEKEKNQIITDLIFTTIQGIEFSLMLGTELNHEGVWREMVYNLCNMDY